eukprot:389364-Amphidinium_carterae.1
MLAEALTQAEGNATGSLVTSSMRGVEAERDMEDTATPLDVRVDESMDRRVPIEDDSPAAVATQLPVGSADQEVVAPVYRVGPHLCHLTA